jgi:SSS family solute:Na+ symporter
LVRVGRIAAAVALVIATPVAIALQNLDQAFQFIQEFTGFVSPGALAIFLLGFFWKRATAKAALLAALGTFVFSLAAKLLLPTMPFMDRMLLVFVLCVLVMIVMSYRQKQESTVAFIIEPGMFATTRAFKAIAAAIVAVLAVIYTVWW